jgi:glutamate synthase domain-containing protein 2
MPKENLNHYVKKLSGDTKPPTSSGRSSIFGQISFDQLSFATAQINKRPQEYFDNEQNIKSETTIGKSSKHPVKINGPAVVAAMSFGALSKQAKIALAKGAAIADTADNTGEGGMLEEQRKEANILIAQYSTGRFGVDEDYLKKADIIEVKYGQGAKPGQGGLLPGHKVTEEIAKTRSSSIKTVKPGEAVHSPPAHPDITSVEELKERIDELRKITDGKPIILKIAACDLEKDLPLAIKANPDVIAIDGAEGGTGAAPHVMLHNTGMPTIAALIEARYILDKLKAPQELWIGGGISTGGDMAKAIALGADVVFVATALMQAMGCINCGQCHLGKCPGGIATQEEELAAKLDVDEAAKKIANYFKSTRNEVKMLAAATGYNNIYELKKEDLIPLTKEMSEITGLPFIGIERVKKLFE